jgi:hypothetical protein
MSMEPDCLVRCIASASYQYRIGLLSISDDLIRVCSSKGSTLTYPLTNNLLQANNTYLSVRYISQGIYLEAAEVLRQWG